MGLVAAATDEGEVKVWDGWTGRERLWGREHYEEGQDKDGVGKDDDGGGGNEEMETGRKERKGSGQEEVGALVRSLVFTGVGENGGNGESLLVARRVGVEVWGL